MVKEEWSLVEPRHVCMIRNDVQEGLASQVEINKWLHAKALFTEEQKPVNVLIDTGSSCNVL